MALPVLIFSEGFGWPCTEDEIKVEIKFHVGYLIDFSNIYQFLYLIEGFQLPAKLAKD